ncbi:outer membrane biogenesis protein BamB [Caulifigura coniformis]|uniref:Outer membrane biogenesis protein BamB n=1 Tax=Caulifigura coniformis TaxID=2527983 RepID=A0A517SGI7_9PLAN|nr:PQQ-binding-like beta-propeller repeat protein [Caulifigura coniformis]QDT55245.1 outer membrane biogenesis protein BamB [Caulifigura coniformis]
MNRVTIASVGLVLAWTTCGFGEDWTAFRGSDGQASGQGNPPVKWSAAENLRWTCPLPGPGASSPIVLGDRLYVTCYSGYGVPDGPDGAISELKRHLVCVDRATGKIVWNTVTAADSPEDPYQSMLREHGYASHTPVTDGERIYVFYGKTGVLAFDLDGRELWRHNVGKESSPMRWGSAASPVLVGDLLVVNASDESLSLRGLNKKTGEEVWKAEGTNLESAYGAPAIAKISDERTDIVVSGRQEAWGVNPATGKLRWYGEFGRSGAASPTPIVHGQTAYLFGGRGSSTVALKLDGKGDVTNSSVVWKAQPGSYTSTPVLVDGRLYWLNDQRIATCIDAATGKTVFQGRTSLGRDSGKLYSSPVAAAGRIYQVTSRGGTIVFAAKPEYEELALNTIETDDSDFNGTPALSGDEMFLRSNKALYCIAAPLAK